MSEESEKRFKHEVVGALKTLSEDISDIHNDDQTVATETLIQKSSDLFAKRWKLKDEFSEIAFRGLLLVLEYCLSYELSNQSSFAAFLDALGFHTVLFWKKAIQYLFESDMEHGTNYRDALLFR